MVGPKSFPPTIGGIETHVYEIATRMASRGHKVTVIVPKASGTRDGTVDGVNVVRVPCISNRYMLKLSMIPWIMRRLDERPDAIVHAHDATGGFASAVKVHPDRFVYTMHGTAASSADWPTPFRQGIRRMQRKALRRAKHVFCTDSRAAEHAKAIRSQLEILSSGVDASAYSRHAGMRPEAYEDGKFVFLFVGRLAKVKGVDILLRALRMMPAEARRGMIMAFVGDGPLRNEVLASAKEIEEIRFIGTVDHASIPPYYSHADAYVLPSLSEGLPMSLLEAMAAGLPSIASDVGGISTQIQRDALMLVKPGDPEALARALQELRTDRGLRETMGMKGRALVQEEFSWDKIVDRILEVYSSLG
jgi:glycosyltransferase involved in cell wall biosynthesis